MCNNQTTPFINLSLRLCMDRLQITPKQCQSHLFVGKLKVTKLGQKYCDTSFENRRMKTTILFSNHALYPGTFVVLIFHEWRLAQSVELCTLT